MTTYIGGNRSSTSLITPSISILSQSQSPQVDAHVVQFAHLELIKTLLASASAERKRRAATEQFVSAELGQADSDRPGAADGTSDAEVIQTEIDDSVRKRLDEIGFKVGWTMAESLAKEKPRFPSAPPTSTSSSSAPPPSETHVLEVIKFICKDLWIALYDKQVDNLRTNHRGVYVLVDNAFKPLSRVSSVGGSKEEDEVARWVRFPGAV
ncbi:trafficking protein particle complex subunit 6, partial [Phenoliferia sp. Uapishka_3]